MQFIAIQYRLFIRHFTYRLLPTRFIQFQPFAQRAFTFFNQHVQYLKLFFNPYSFFSYIFRFRLILPFQFFYFPLTFLPQSVDIRLLLANAEFQFLIFLSQFIDTLLTIFHFFLMRTLVSHFLKFQIPLCLLVTQLVHPIIYCLNLLLLRRSYFFLFHAKLLHQLLLLHRNLRFPSKDSCLLSILKRTEISLQIIGQ